VEREEIEPQMTQMDADGKDMEELVNKVNNN
jgi:hypothetical protein